MGWLWEALFFEVLVVVFVGGWEEQMRIGAKAGDDMNYSLGMQARVFLLPLWRDNAFETISVCCVGRAEETRNRSAYANGCLRISERLLHLSMVQMMGIEVHGSWCEQRYILH